MNQSYASLKFVWEPQCLKVSSFFILIGCAEVYLWQAKMQNWFLNVLKAMHTSNRFSATNVKVKVENLLPSFKGLVVPYPFNIYRNVITRFDEVIGFIKRSLLIVYPFKAHLCFAILFYFHFMLTMRRDEMIGR